jgi:hypothetical protein
MTLAGMKIDETFLQEDPMGDEFVYLVVGRCSYG